MYGELRIRWKEEGLDGTTEQREEDTDGRRRKIRGESGKREESGRCQAWNVYVCIENRVSEIDVQAPVAAMHARLFDFG